MNKNIKFIIIIDIIVIVLFGYSYSMWINNNKEPIIQYNEYSFRNFNYKIPKTVSYQELDDKKFELKDKEWNAIIEVFIDENNNIFKYPDIYYDSIINNGYKVDDPIKIRINDKEVIIYKKYDKNNNSLLCYFNTESPFAFEVELINKDNSFNTDNLEYIMNILLNAKYDNSSGQKYEYFSAKYLEEIAETEPLG